jgi:hypothetical protein
MVQKGKSQKRRPKNKFIAVDVWRAQFGPVSVRAIYEVYAQTFGVETHNMKKYSLSQCINALRKLEDPSYEEPKDQISNS